MSGAGQNEGMTRYRPPAVLLLFLVLNLTACSSWQSIGPVSPSRFIELDQPERVRVRIGGGRQVELERPAIDGSELVGAGGFSIPLEDVLVLEVKRFDAARTIKRVGYGALGTLIALYVLCPASGEAHGGPICDL